MSSTIYIILPPYAHNASALTFAYPGALVLPTISSHDQWQSPPFSTGSQRPRGLQSWHFVGWSPLAPDVAPIAKLPFGSRDAAPTPTVTHHCASLMMMCALAGEPRVGRPDAVAGVSASCACQPTITKSRRRFRFCEARLLLGCEVPMRCRRRGRSGVVMMLHGRGRGWRLARE